MCGGGLGLRRAPPLQGPAKALLLRLRLLFAGHTQHVRRQALPRHRARRSALRLAAEPARAPTRRRASLLHALRFASLATRYDSCARPVPCRHATNAPAVARRRPPPSARLRSASFPPQAHKGLGFPSYYWHPPPRMTATVPTRFLRRPAPAPFAVACVVFRRRRRRRVSRRVRCAGAYATSSQATWRFAS